MAERLTSQCLAQYLLILIAQLYFAFDKASPSSGPGGGSDSSDQSQVILPRLVVAFNLLFTVARLADLSQPRRLRLFAAAVVYLPVGLTFFLALLTRGQQFQLVKAFLTQ